MTTTTTRGGTSAAHTSGTARAPRSAQRNAERGAARERYEDYVDGATARQLGYAEPMDEPIPHPDSRPGSRPGRTTPAPARQTDRRPLAPEAPRSGAAPVRLPRASFLLLVAGVVVIGVLGLLLLNTKINENAFRMDSLQQEGATLNQQEAALAQEVAQRESPGELRAAAARLGLVPAGTPAFINLPDGRIVGVPQPAPADAAGAGQ